MDQWLASIEADSSNTLYSIKFVKNNPASAHDLCTHGNGDELPQAICVATQLIYAKPRAVAGESSYGDVVQCQLKPLAKADYGTIQFSDAQWSQLQATFPSGVCDYSKPAVGRTPTVPWLGYSAGPGGQPLTVTESLKVGYHRQCGVLGRKVVRQTEHHL